MSDIIDAIEQHECYECGRLWATEAGAKRCSIICKTNYDMSH